MSKFNKIMSIFKALLVKHKKRGSKKQKTEKNKVNIISTNLKYKNKIMLNEICQD